MYIFRHGGTFFCQSVWGLKPCTTHEQIKYPLYAQVLDPYEVILSRFPQINSTLFAHVYKAVVLILIFPSLKQHLEQIHLPVLYLECNTHK